MITHSLYPIPSLPGYYADAEGNIWSRRQSRIPRKMRVFPDSRGRYLRFEATLGSRADGVNVIVHNAVCEAFHGPSPDGKPCARHLDGDNRNNRPENLAWGSHAENSNDMIEHGRSLTGARNLKAKLTPEQVLQIRALRATKNTVELAAMFGVTNTNISFICNRRTWRHL